MFLHGFAYEASRQRAIFRAFVKNAIFYAKTHNVSAFEPPPQSSEIVLNAHEKATKDTKTPSAWRAIHQLVGTIRRATSGLKGSLAGAMAAMRPCYGDH